MNSFSAKSDAELAAMASHGDQEAFACLYDRYRAMIFAKAREAGKRFGCDVIEDMAQEAGIGFLKAVRSFDPSKNVGFRTYALVCIDHNLATSVRNYLSQRNAILNCHSQLDSPEAGERAALSIDQDPEGLVLEGESQSAVFSSLSNFEQEVVKLRFKGLSYEETAKALGVSVKSVDNAIQRVRHKIKASRKD
ncbi:MAG: sigma-70 family RNA polymerase sigma factor [Clostridia bacterium]|nr:sigma-70 family RNA polymerase sigma factor [Clostridia bacterium]